MIYDINTIQPHLDKLRGKVQKEYERGFRHIQTKIEDKKKVLWQLLPKVAQWEVKAHLLWKNLNLENSIMLLDELTVTVVSEDWILADEQAKNAKSVFKFDTEYLDLYDNKEEIVNYCWLYGLWCNAILDYDVDENAPITTSIHPFMIIPDPNCWKGSKMRHIGFKRRVDIDSIKNNPIYKTDRLFTVNDAEYQKMVQSKDSNLWYVTIVDDEWLTDLYDHFTVFEWHKYQTTWTAWCWELIRLVELEPLSDAEKKRPEKIKYPVVLYRRKPIIWSFYGASIADEVLQEQDVMSLLLNLMTIQANMQALWPDTYADTSLWIDVNKLARMWMPWGRIIPVSPKTSQSIQNSFFQNTNASNQSFPLQMIELYQKFSNDNLSRWEIAFWQSASWQQTKAEVNTLMENINQALWYISQNYMRSEKDYWELIYKSYALNMSPSSTKNVVLFESWKALNKRMRKEEFVVEWRYQLYITSKAQERVQNEKDFQKLVALQWVLLANIADESGKNNFLRFIAKKVNIEWFNPTDFIVETIDEAQAKRNVELLNNNIKINKPKPWENFKTRLDIYKTALDTEATREAILLYEQAYLAQPRQQQMQWQWDKLTQWMAMNNINQQQNKNPSLNNVTV